eukprot:3765018-Amphidinium_carterae.1
MPWQISNHEIGAKDNAPSHPGHGAFAYLATAAWGRRQVADETFIFLTPAISDAVPITSLTNNFNLLT